MRTQDDYRKQLEVAARGALREAVAKYPSATVAELRQLVAEHPALGTMTLAELTDGRRPIVVRGAVAKQFDSLWRSSGDKPASEARPAKARAVEVRTASGREQLDAAVHAAIAAFGGIEVSAEAIRTRVGGTPAQIRTSLNRQIAAGALSFTGKARGTRYSLT